MVRRDIVHQKRPKPGQDLSGFPSRRILKNAKIHRAHLTAYSPWHFTSAPKAGEEHKGGRFDTPFPAGTCYVANNALTALAEKLGPKMLKDLPPDAFDSWSVSSIALPRTYRTVDLDDQSCVGHGVISSEISSASPYRTTQAWAAAWHGHHFEGVRYRPRHDPQRSATSFALFDEGGDASKDDRRWPIPSATPARFYKDEFEETFKVQFRSIPSRRSAKIIPLPPRRGPRTSGISRRSFGRSRGLPSLRKGELYELAMELDLPGRSRMNRDDLEEAVRRERRRRRRRQQ